MKIYFARHGQTDWNLLGKVQGTTDIPLNETGIAQAHRLCEKIKEENIDIEKIYTSSQIRAVQTAQIVDERYRVGYEIVKGLEEMNLGDFEGHTWNEINALFPKELQYWNEDRRYHTSPNGESYQMVIERVFTALDHIIGQHDTASDKSILIVSHGAIIATLIAMQQDPPFSDYRIAVENATPVEFSMKKLEEKRERLR
ncbi:MAG: histidine phosphatase family protein [Lachnospiraceae bacterium]|nr:histidine phosphatase family protein [Lachnospiraceae bacterium]